MGDYMTVSKPLVIPTGDYTGIITRGESRTTPQKWEYKDYYIEVNLPGSEDKPERKISFAKHVSEKSKLGRFLAKFGVTIVPDTQIDVDCIVGRKVAFSIVNEFNEEKTSKFSNIVLDTVEPLVEQQSKTVGSDKEVHESAQA